MVIKCYRVFELSVFKRWHQESLSYDCMTDEETCKYYKTKKLVKKYYPEAVDYDKYCEDNYIRQKSDFDDDTYTFYEQIELEIIEK